MISPNQYYRKFKCIVEWYDTTAGRTHSSRRTLNLGDVSMFEEFVDNRFPQGVDRIYVFFNINIPPAVVRISYLEFDKLFEEYHESMRTLDNRTQKKKLNYEGPMKFHFDSDDQVMTSVVYPFNYDFRNKPPDVIMDALLCNFITPMN